MWRRSRLSLGEVYAALKRLRRCAQTHIAPLSDWMLRGTRTHTRTQRTETVRERLKAAGRVLQSSSRLLLLFSSAGSSDTGELLS